MQDELLLPGEIFCSSTSLKDNDVTRNNSINCRSTKINSHDHRVVPYFPENNAIEWKKKKTNFLFFSRDYSPIYI